jgi:hypothetical protein
MTLYLVFLDSINNLLELDINYKKRKKKGEKFNNNKEL